MDVQAVIFISIVIVDSYKNRVIETTVFLNIAMSGNPAVLPANVVVYLDLKCYIKTNSIWAPIDVKYDRIYRNWLGKVYLVPLFGPRKRSRKTIRVIFI